MSRLVNDLLFKRWRIGLKKLIHYTSIYVSVWCDCNYRQKQRKSSTVHKDIWLLMLYFILMPHLVYCTVGWWRRIHQLHLCRGVRPPLPQVVCPGYVLMVRLQYCWSFVEFGIHLHCYHSQVHSGPEWTWKGSICGSNRTVWHLNSVQTNDLC